MCNCIRESAFNKSFTDGIEKKSPFYQENEGLRKWKSYLDEKYKNEALILSDNQNKVSENTGKHKIHKCLEDVNPDRRK